MAVTNLEADREELCPGEIVTIAAETTPPAGSVLWTVGEGPFDQFGMHNGVPTFGNRFDADGNLILPQGVITAEGDAIQMRFRRGETRVITASHGPPSEMTSLSVTVTWKAADVRLQMDVTELLISAEPRMQPQVVTVKAVGIGGQISVSEWHGEVGLRNFIECHGPTDLDTLVELPLSDAGDEIVIDLADIIRGGYLEANVKGTVNGCPVETGFQEFIRGTNPAQGDIQEALPHDTLRRIACKESGQRQFDAPPNGGTSFCPFFGPGGNVGIMQISREKLSPTADEVWDWRANVAKGIEIFNEKMDAARNYPDQVRNSAGFQDLVHQFNQKREQQGLNLLEATLPHFIEGNLDDDDLQQLELDAIRGCNGWEGSDRFGFELHEFKVAVDVVDGEEVLRVNNINESTLEGEAVWVRVPVDERPPLDHSSVDPNYVNAVLALSPSCATPACQIEIVDAIGAPLSALPSAEVGQRMELGVRVVQPPGGAITEVKWDIGGMIVGNYDITKSKNQVVAVMNADLQKANIRFYWIDADPHPIGHRSVDVTAIVNGMPCSTNALFSVLRPNVSRFEVKSVGIIRADDQFNTTSRSYLSFGQDPTKPGFVMGIIWEAEVTTSDTEGPGQLGFFQIIRSDRRKTGLFLPFLQKSVADQLDLGFPYVTPASIGKNNRTSLFAGDSPAVLLDGLTGASISETFRTYLAYRPNGPGNIWVPLRRIDWGWCASATLNPPPLGWTLDAAHFHFPAVGTAGVDTNGTGLPTWSGLVQNGQYSPGLSPTTCPAPPP